MTTKADVAHFVSISIARSGKTNMQIASEAGFAHPNVLSMIKKGHTLVPMARIPALATAMSIDPKVLLDKCLAAYHPELHQVLSSLAPSLLISRSELSVIKALRHAVRSGALT